MDISVTPSQSEVGRVVDLPLGNFIDEIKPKNIGYVLSLKNFLTRLYFDLKKDTDDLVNKAKDLPKGDTEREKTIKTVNDIYVKMQSVEDKILYLEKRAKQLEIEI